MNKNIKLLVAGLLLVAAIYLFTLGEISWGILLVFLSLVVTFFYFINEYILLAFLKMRKQDVEGSQKFLAKITNPEKQLFSKSIGYYYYMSGMTKAQNNLKDSQKDMRTALKYGLPFGHDTAMAKLSLAGEAMQKGDKKSAKKLLSEARKADSRGVVLEQIEMMEEQMVKVQKTPTGQMGRGRSQVRGRSRYF